MEMIDSIDFNTKTQELQMKMSLVTWIVSIKTINETQYL